MAVMNLLRAAGTSGLILDTGFRSDQIASPTTMASLVGVPAWEVVRLAPDVVEAGSVADGVSRTGVPIFLPDTGEGALPRRVAAVPLVAAAPAAVAPAPFVESHDIVRRFPRPSPLGPPRRA